MACRHPVVTLRRLQLRRNPRTRSGDAAPVTTWQGRALALVAAAEVPAGVRTGATPMAELVVGNGVARRVGESYLLAHLPPLPPGHHRDNHLHAAPAAGVGLLRRPRTGEALVPHADVILLPRLLGSALRVRAFYLTPPRVRPVTLGVHQRQRGGPSSRLLAGTDVMRTVRPHAALLLPCLLGTGRRRSFDWSLEELLPGETPLPADFDVSGAELADALLQTWARLPHTRVPFSAFLPPTLVAEVEELLGSQPDGLVGDGAALARKVRALAGSDLQATVSLCHGDPVLGNTLRMPDGRLALVDWELAGELPVGGDLAKVMMSVRAQDVVRDVLDRHVRAPRPLFAADWRPELAAAFIRWLGGWRAQETTAARSGRSVAFTRRLGERVGHLEALLTP